MRLIKVKRDYSEVGEVFEDVKAAASCYTHYIQIKDMDFIWKVLIYNILSSFLEWGLQINCYYCVRFIGEKILAESPLYNLTLFHRR